MCILLYKNGATWGFGHEFLVIVIVDRMTGLPKDFWRLERFGEYNELEPGLNWKQICSTPSKALSSPQAAEDKLQLLPSNTRPPLNANDKKVSSSYIISSSFESKMCGLDVFRTNTNLTQLIHEDNNDITNDESEYKLEFNQEVNPYALLVLSSCIHSIVPDYRLLTSNCYFFVCIVCVLAGRLFGKENAITWGGKLGKVSGGADMAFLKGEKFSAIMDQVEELYLKTWADINEKVSFLSINSLKIYT